MANRPSPNWQYIKYHLYIPLIVLAEPGGWTMLPIPPFKGNHKQPLMSWSPIQVGKLDLLNKPPSLTRYQVELGRQTWNSPQEGVNKKVRLDIPWNYPPPSNSDHQDFATFLIGNPYKPSFLTVTGWGVDRRYTNIKWLPSMKLTFSPKPLKNRGPLEKKGDSELGKHHFRGELLVLGRVYSRISEA